MKVLKLGAIILFIVKSFFLAVTQVAWGLISLFGFNALIVYLNRSQDFDITSINKLFLQLEIFISQHIMLFVAVFFVLYLYFEVKEILK